MKTAEMHIEGKKYVLALTFGAMKELCDKYGDLGGVVAAYEGKNLTEQYTIALNQLGALLRGGADYLKAAKGVGQKNLTEEDLGAMLSIGSTLDIRMKVAETLTNGMTREVETESKNANATQTVSR